MADKTLPPVAIGDSLAVGMRDANKIPGLGRVGAGPREVLDMIKRFSAENSLSGRDVFIGTGMPNIPAQKKFIEEQIDFVKKQGGNPILMGVGPGTKKKPTTGQNEFLAGLAERKGLKYMGPLVNQFPDITKDPMGLHLRGPQYQQIFKQYSKPQPAQPTQQQTQPQSRAPSAADLLSQFTGAVMQAESRGKRYDKSGKLLTSPKGAMGEMQVMPGTVRDPGFGVRPAKDNSPDELARVGRDYAATMLRRYNNDPTAAAVAYNWGPGNADKWVKRGADFNALPKETQKYVTRITGQMGIPIAAKRAPAPKRADVPPVPPQKRAETPPQKRAAAEDFDRESTLELSSRPAEQPQGQITRADMDRLGPSYQAAFAAMALADSREDDDDFYDDDETIAERYMERREMRMAQGESTIEEEEPARVSPLASLSEISYQSPFAEQQPVMMANGGEARAMLDGLEPTFGQRMGAKLSDVATKGLINIYDAARLTEGALSSKESAAEKEQKMSAAHKIYLDTFGFRGRRDPVTAEYFNPEEQKAIAALIAEKGGKKGSIQYKDYGMDKRDIQKNDILSGQLDPYVSVNKSLGQFNYEYDPKTKSYRVTDQYDFNPLVDAGGRQVSSDFMGDYLSDVPGLYNKARTYAGRNMPPGTGRKVDFMVPAQVPVKRAEGSPVYGEVSGRMFSPKPLTIPAPLTDLADFLKLQFSKERRSMRKPGSVTDVSLRGPVAFAMGAPMDLVEMAGRGADYLQTRIPALRKKASVMDTGPERDAPMGYAPKVQVGPKGTMPYGTEYAQDLMRRSGLTTGEERPLTEMGVAVLSPFAAAKTAKLGKELAPAAKDIIRSAGPQIEKTLGKTVDPLGTGLAEPMNIIKNEGGNWMPTRERSDVVNDYTANLIKDTRVGDEIKNNKFTVDLYQSTVNSDKFILQDYKDFIKRLYQDTPLLWSKMEKNKKISLAQSYREEIIKRKQELAKSQQKLDEAQAELARPQSIANFIENKLQPYIRNNLGTPSDQVRIRMDKWELEEQPKLIAEKQKQIDKVRADINRAAAARGNIDPLILTRSQEQLRKLMNEMEGIKSRTGSFFQMGPGEREAMLRRYDMVRGSNPRGEIGTVNFPATPTVAKSGLGKVWEETVDFSVDAYKPSEAASEYASIYGKEPPAWLTKAAESGDKKGIYSLDYRSGETLPYQFRHMIDELMSSVDPQSNLPKELRRTPKEIEKMSVDAAADLVDKINGWRASNITGLDLARANNSAVFEVKAYKTIPNTDLPNEKSLRWVEIKMPEGMNEKEGRKVLDDALKYEGEIMKHCVGAYCPKVEEGTKIFSLRDDAGRPYTTIEAAPDMDVVEEIFKKEFGESSWTRNFKPTSDAGLLEILTQELGQTIPYKIKQIKGVRNGAPIEEAIPFVRDFVSDPQWTDVADINLIGGL
jgi:hypothetical protein